MEKEPKLLSKQKKLDCQTRNIINFLKKICLVCFESDNGGLSFKLYKQVVSVKSLYNFSNNNPNDPYSFKEKIKIKFNTLLAVVEKFPNRTRTMIELLKAET